ncbi:GSCOCT00006533001.3-RA-CDS [Cotesia congregata]|uniref:Odorant receptor n=1 Tax=Cotesia congregata TaxID=51543 RepID=A0A8J2HQB8_COTCN|nr:GSCOCT00006533001.3-RA-CDS [Cotesia congregata]CAG5106408.1 olfactory receptor 146 [Cotesia congregata]
MNFFDQPYYSLLRTFGCIVGRWPLQTSLQKFVIGIVINLAYILQVGPKILADIVHSDDQELIFETLAPTITDVGAFSKYINTFINRKMINKLLDRIEEDWRLATNYSEKVILKKYAAWGKLMATGYVGFVYTTTVMFVTEPMLPMLVNTILKTNLTAPHKFAVPMEWIVIDKDKYYWLLLTNSSICIMVILTTLISYDVIFITVVHHAYGLFAITGYRIKNFPNNTIQEKNFSKFDPITNRRDINYKHLVSCIRIHRRALEFAEFIEDTFTGCFGFGIVLNLPTYFLQIMAASNTFQQKMKYFMFAVAQMLHLFFECFLSQQLTDLSMQVQQHIANGKWYDISAKSQKLLILMTMRCQVPCTLTAGKIMGLSIESFGAMIKTSGSYFTMLLSMQ